MTTPFIFKLARTFNAPLDTVWDAWTDADKLGLWFSPKGVTTFLAKLDLKPGGSYHYGLENPDGSRYYGRWIFEEVHPKTSLVFIVSFSNDKMEITHHPMAPTWPREMHSTITFTPKGDKTEVEVQWKAHNASEIEMTTFEAGAESMKGGWGGTFDNFAGYVEG
jgi:uncharacterized protein YndB with AHSA1/START domain